MSRTFDFIKTFGIIQGSDGIWLKFISSCKIALQVEQLRLARWFHFWDNITGWVVQGASFSCRLSSSRCELPLQVEWFKVWATLAGRLVWGASFPCRSSGLRCELLSQVKWFNLQVIHTVIYPLYLIWISIGLTCFYWTFIWCNPLMSVHPTPTTVLHPRPNQAPAQTQPRPTAQKVYRMATTQELDPVQK